MAEKMNNLSGKEWLQNSFTIWRDIRKTKEETQLKHPAMFPSELAEKLIKIYTKDDGEVILDPFLGVGSTLLASKKLNKKGIGVELSKEFAEIAKTRLSKTQLTLDLKQAHEFKQEVINDDANNLLKYVKEESVDLCINSPPYWDILNQKRTVDNREIGNYSDSDKDLGNIENYEEFLKGLKEVYSEVYKVLKPNKRCCVVVMDIRKKDKFYPLHIDITKIMEEIGFELEEFVIWDRQHEYNNMKTLGYPWVFRFNKVHEFICIFWKRDRTKKGS
ncbi:MAG: site-specific DNA-methyltransferase [archaeon]